MPGHSTAAIAAYPQYACRHNPTRVREIWGVSTHIYCPTEAAFRFLDGVLNEVMALFPGHYIHIGGDEVPFDEWQRSAFVTQLMRREHLPTYAAVQGYFTRRIEAYLRSRGRRMVGWDEILAGGVTQTATVMSWRGEAGGIAAAKRGNDAVMTPDGPLYFDAYQGDRAQEPPAIGGLSTLRMVYDYDPVHALDAQQAHHILGVQANLWTEYIATPQYLFYMLEPREIALAEVAWTPASQKNWDAFAARLPAQFTWLETHKIPFRMPNPQISLSGAPLTFDSVTTGIQTLVALTPNDAVSVTLSQPVRDAELYYTTDGTAATISSSSSVAASVGVPYDGPCAAARCTASTTEGCACPAIIGPQERT